MIARLGWPLGDGAGDEIQSCIKVPGKKSNHSQAVERCRVIGQRGQDLPVDLLRFEKPSAEEVRLGELERFFDGNGGPRSD